MKLDPYLTLYTKSNSNLVKGLCVKAKTINFLKKLQVSVFVTVDFSGLLDMTPQRQATKEKLVQLDLIKIKNLCTLKNTIKKMKR